MQPVLQLADLDNSSHTHPTHQRATNRPARKQRYLVSEQYCMLAQIYVFFGQFITQKRFEERAISLGPCFQAEVE